MPKDSTNSPIDKIPEIRLRYIKSAVLKETRETWCSVGRYEKLVEFSQMREQSVEIH